ncbi:MAG TPA: serine/threonine-protein kinase, partial [Candidatus Xenobia bacterium]
VMEYIKGRSFQAVLDSEEEFLTEAMVLVWAEELCVVLEYLHTHEPPVVFRDLKPANVILDVEGHIKLVDFGISKLFGGGVGTQTFAKGAVSPGFTSPEQYGGTSDPRSDIYSLGATLYCLLTKITPPSAVERAAEIVTLTPLRTLRPDVSVHLASAVEQLMTVRAADRPSTIADVRLLLHPEAAPAPAAAGPETVGARPRRQGSSGPVPAIVATVSVLVLGLGAWFWHSSPTTNPDPGQSASASPGAVGQAGQVRIESHPAGASIKWNGVDRGVTPVLISAPPGEYWVQVAKAGYAPGQVDVTLQSGDDKTVDIPMVRNRSSVQIRGYPAGTLLAIDGRDQGQLDPGTASFDLGPGRHELRFTKRGYRPVVKYIMVDQHTQATLPITMVRASDPPN